MSLYEAFHVAWKYKQHTKQATQRTKNVWIDLHAGTNSKKSWPFL